MTKTEHLQFLQMKTRRFVLALLVGAATLVPLQARAQDVRSLINYYTAKALSNGGTNVEGAQLITEVWYSSTELLSLFTRYQWQFLADVGGVESDYCPGGFPHWCHPMRITSANSFKYMDMLEHTAALHPVHQARKLLLDNSTPWKFQAWFVKAEFAHPNASGPAYYTLRNWGSGMCLADAGLPYPSSSSSVPGPVVQMPCDLKDARQLWAIWNRNLNRWERNPID